MILPTATSGDAADRDLQFLRKPAALVRRLNASVQLQERDAVNALDRSLADIVARARPIPLRAFDQIPMRADDLARQGRMVAPLLAHQRVAFIGDLDGAASLLGLVAATGGPVPARLLLLDFDTRVLQSALLLAEHYGFAHILETRLYNCFDSLPLDLIGKSDWFYINPPYGSRNSGGSGRLFLTRGCEIVRPQGGSGCVILPDDVSRPWTRRGMIATEQFLHTHGWTIREKVDQLHRYHLDDDPELSSSLIIVDRSSETSAASMPFAGRSVGTNEIPNFYGRSTLPPFPRFINQDGALRGTVAMTQEASERS